MKLRMPRQNRESRAHATEFTPRPDTRRTPAANRAERAPLPGSMRQRGIDDVTQATGWSSSVPLTLLMPVAGDLATLAPATDLPPSQVRHDAPRPIEPRPLLDANVAPLKAVQLASADPTRELPAVGMYERAYESGDWPDETKPHPLPAPAAHDPVGTPEQEAARLWSIRRGLMATLTPHREAEEADELARAADAAALRNDLRTDRLEKRMESLQKWWNGLCAEAQTALLPRIVEGGSMPFDIDALVETLVDLPPEEYTRKLEELLNADGPVAA